MKCTQKERWLRGKSAYLDALDWWEEFLWKHFKSYKWPGTFVLFNWAQKQLTCKLRLCDDCPNCETYVCPSCFKRLPWSNGCADSLGDICDDCWAKWRMQYE